MNRKFCSLLAAAMLVSSGATAMAEPGGCIKYGAAGAVAGHVAKGHSVIGAVGGCVVGMYQRHKYRKGLRIKAAAWDKEHANDPSVKNLKLTAAQKADAYDAEHKTPGNSIPAQPATQPAATPAAQ
ncbi:hypothetical protein GS501_08100 [Saccharibacter sp. 17.LH.SD]|uniref:hypothetical protein n=1 Tax=Saccharibacter sp. 17.LH.SD TaxID=2689393 RepID=UPI0013696764|nr:hypothetical protein [Saccharibacter sp. 17.LH.SD]MXV44999.1 hypothetical protein [Saccharibacter sp. 17.LH.SD]